MAKFTGFSVFEICFEGVNITTTNVGRSSRSSDWALNLQNHYCQSLLACYEIMFPNLMWEELHFSVIAVPLGSFVFHIAKYLTWVGGGG